MKRFLKTWVWSFVLAGVGLLMFSMVSIRGVSAQTTDPTSVVETFFDTTTTDIDAALALVTDDAVIRIVPPPPNTPGGVWTGKEQIRGYLEFIRTQAPVRERVGNVQMVGDKYVFTVKITVNDFRKWGVGAVEHTNEVVLQEGKIKSLTSIMAPAERDRVRAAAQRFQATDPVAVADAFHAAQKNNAAAGLALLADDAVVRVVPPPPNTPNGTWTGKEQLRQYMEFSVVQDTTIERIGSAQVEGDKATITVMVLVNDFRQWGLSAVEHSVEVVVQNGKIKSYTTTMALAERDRVRAAAEAYFAANPPAGMPRTGGEQSVSGSLLITLAMLAMLSVLVGFSLMRIVKPHTT